MLYICSCVLDKFFLSVWDCWAWPTGSCNWDSSCMLYFMTGTVEEDVSHSLRCLGTCTRKVNYWSSTLSIRCFMVVSCSEVQKWWICSFLLNRWQSWCGGDLLYVLIICSPWLLLTGTSGCFLWPDGQAWLSHYLDLCNRIKSSAGWPYV